MKQPEIVEGNGEAYRAGRFVYTVEGRSVIVTRDPMLEAIAYYEYPNSDRAADAAWHMATLQLQANV